MKKCYLKLLLGVISLLSFSGLKAQTYVSGDITAIVMPSMSHDSTTCSSTCNVMCTITINSSFMGDSVFVVDTNSASLIYAAGNTTGATSWTLSVPVPMYMSNVPDDMIAVGGGMANFFGPTIKIISGPDTIHAITNFYSLMVTNPCTYGNVAGMVYVDNNGDCTYNSGDIPLNAIQVVSTANLSSPVATISSSAYSGVPGTYSMNVQQSWMTNYTVTIPWAYYFIFPASPCFTAFPTPFISLPMTNVDFPLQCTNNVDVACWAGSPSNARPLHSFYMQPYVSNMGCDSASGQLIFIKDSRVTYNASLSTNPATTVSGDTLKWNYANLTNLTNGAYWNSFMSDIHLTPNSTVNIGDTLCFRIYTGVMASDINAANNDYSICIPVVASYDPNIKEVSPAGATVAGNIPASTPSLTYTIHFQNTGTAAAYNVSVVDTLDSDVDPSSLKILGTSHSMSPQWLAPGVVKFNFISINLPDSTTNEPASHGSVRFSVKPHPGLAIGTQIKNKGYIYFDSNPAVITNTALNTIAANTGVEASHLTNNDVNVYPNPATDNIFVEHLQGGKLSILSMNGSVIIVQDITSNKAEIDISRLPVGMYILRTVDRNITTTRKFVKQ